MVGDSLGQLPRAQPGRVDDDVRGGPQVSEQAPLTHDAVEQAAVILERQRPPVGFLPLHDHLVTGLDEQHRDAVSA